MNIFESIKHIKLKDINFFDVIQGCVDSYLTDWNVGDREQVKKVSLYRLKVCGSCHMNSNGWCDNTGNKKITHVETGEQIIGCGCNLKCRTALLSYSCPAAKWKAVNPA